MDRRHRFPSPPEDQQDATFGTQLDRHVRAVVDDPDVVVRVDTHRVRPGHHVEVLANLPNEAAIRAELEKLRRPRADHMTR